MKRAGHIRLLAITLVGFFLSTLLFSLCFHPSSSTKSKGYFLSSKSAIPTSSDTQILYEEREGEYRPEDNEQADEGYVHFDNICYHTSFFKSEVALKNSGRLNAYPCEQSFSVDLPIYLAYRSLLI